MSKGHNGPTVIEHADPPAVYEAKELQHYGTVVRLPIALATSVCAASVENLNQLRADTVTLRDLYNHERHGGCPRGGRRLSCWDRNRVTRR